jgi:hypothetical protein
MGAEFRLREDEAQLGTRTSPHGGTNRSELCANGRARFAYHHPAGFALLVLRASNSQNRYVTDPMYERPNSGRTI